MDIEYIKECVYAGLRRCKKQPDALICLSNKEYFGNKISLTLIMYGEHFEHPLNVTTTEEILFIPVWYDSENTKEARAFYRGYVECV